MGITLLISSVGSCLYPSVYQPVCLLFSKSGFLCSSVSDWGLKGEIKGEGAGSHSWWATLSLTGKHQNITSEPTYIYTPTYFHSQTRTTFNFPPSVPSFMTSTLNRTAHSRQNFKFWIHNAINPWDWRFRESCMHMCTQRNGQKCCYK